ncbi:TPA: type II toxin-antitoxin system RelE/ParE family toxin [Candidatus Woesearchaeota archaeon]|nr:type II toxin-antitoxin system RelE/ParE family toxin [Candidatus Woesearchaeota archaeon]
MSIDLSQNSDKFLQKLDVYISERIKDRLKRLSEVPIPSDAKFIGREDGDKIFRYRIGDFRALYKVKDNEKIVLVVKIDKRPRVYEK